MSGRGGRESKGKGLRLKSKMGKSKDSFFYEKVVNADVSLITARYWHGEVKNMTCLLSEIKWAWHVYWVNSGCKIMNFYT